MAGAQPSTSRSPSPSFWVTSDRRAHRPWWSARCSGRCALLGLDVAGAVDRGDRDRSGRRASSDLNLELRRVELRSCRVSSRLTHGRAAGDRGQRLRSRHRRSSTAALRLRLGSARAKVASPSGRAHPARPPRPRRSASRARPVLERLAGPARRARPRDRSPASPGRRPLPPARSGDRWRRAPAARAAARTGKAGDSTSAGPDADPDDSHEAVQKPDPHRVEAALDEPEGERERTREGHARPISCAVRKASSAASIVWKSRPAKFDAETPARLRRRSCRCPRDRPVEAHHQHDLRLVRAAGLRRPVQVEGHDASSSRPSRPQHRCADQRPPCACRRSAAAPARFPPARHR